LGGRVKILLNRAQRHTLIPIAEVEKLLELPVYMSFPNDYVGVHRALTAGKNVNPASELGAGFRALAQSIRTGSQPPKPSKPGFMELLRSRKKHPAESGVLAT
jgi:Flp pilus assembly CpaE family ATPase